MKKTTMVFDPELHAQLKEYAKENCRGNVTLAVDVLLRGALVSEKVRKHIGGAILTDKIRKHKEGQDNG
jgi:hypothetical protein